MTFNENPSYDETNIGMFPNIHALDVSYDTSAFEVAADLDANGQLTPKCAQQVCEHIDRDGFAIVQNFLSNEECATGMEVVQAALVDRDREHSAFASQTDIHYRRRDFCPLPTTKLVLRTFFPACPPGGACTDGVLQFTMGRPRDVDINKLRWIFPPVSPSRPSRRFVRICCLG